MIVDLWPYILIQTIYIYSTTYYGDKDWSKCFM